MKSSRLVGIPTKTRFWHCGEPPDPMIASCWQAGGASLSSASLSNEQACPIGSGVPQGRRSSLSLQGRIHFLCASTKRSFQARKSFRRLCLRFHQTRLAASLEGVEFPPESLLAPFSLCRTRQRAWLEPLRGSQRLTRSSGSHSRLRLSRFTPWVSL